MYRILFSNVHEEHLTGEHSEKQVCMLILRKNYVILEMLNNKRQLQKGLKECPLAWVQWCSISSSRCVYPLQVYSSSGTWAQQHIKSPQFNTWLMSRDKESTHSHLQKMERVYGSNRGVEKEVHPNCLHCLHVHSSRKTLILFIFWLYDFFLTERSIIIRTETMWSFKRRLVVFMTRRAHLVLLCS